MNARGRFDTGEEMLLANIQRDLDNLSSKFESFVETDDLHRGAAQAAIKKVDEMHQGLGQILVNTKNLDELPSITKELRYNRYTAWVLIGTLCLLLLLKELRGQEAEMNGITNWKIRPATKPSDWERHQPQGEEK